MKPMITRYGKVRAVKDHIIVENMNFGERIFAGKLVIPGDEGTMTGIRSRWAQVYAVGKDQHDIKVGQWVLISHGRWTRGVEVIHDDGSVHEVRRVDVKDVFGYQDEKPSDTYVAEGKWW